MTEHIETVIIGGGQAGLVTGHHLRKRGRPFVILDENQRIGDAWRQRWDSLRLFTPAKYNGLPGWRFPAPALTFPTKDEVADYLEAYAARFDLPVRTGVSVDGLHSDRNGYLVTSAAGRFEADNVVVASGSPQPSGSRLRCRPRSKPGHPTREKVFRCLAGHRMTGGYVYGEIIVSAGQCAINEPADEFGPADALFQCEAVTGLSTAVRSRC